MKLNQLTINRLPGIDQRISVEPKGTGIHIIFGPNGIGKSSLIRAVCALYWDDRGSGRETSVNAVVELGGAIWRAEREGAKVRWRRGDGEQVTPKLPPSHGHDCFFLRLRDLIDPVQDGGEIAREIQRQMSGGFDPDQVIESLFSRAGPQHGRHEYRQLDAVRKEIDVLVRQQRELKHNEDRLGALLRELEQAQLHKGKINAIERAIELAERREKHADVERQMAALPQSLAKLMGNEAELASGRAKRIDELNGRIREVQQRIEGARDAISQVGFERLIDTAEIEAWRENANELQRIEMDLKTVRKEYEASRGELEEALGAIGGGDLDQVALNTDAHARLFDFLREADTHRQRKNAVHSRLGLLASGGDENAEALQREYDQVRTAITFLRAWLRASEGGEQSPMDKGRRSRLLAGLLLTAVGGILGALIDPVLFMVAVLGAVLAASLLLPRGVLPASSERRNARDAFMKLDIEAPVTWDLDEVDKRLWTLESDVGTLAVKLEKIRDDETIRRSIDNELKGLAETEEHLARHRQSLMEEMNLRELLPDAELVDFARALDGLRSAKAKAENASNRAEHLQEQFAALLKSVADAIGPHVDAEPKDAALAVAAVNELAGRNARLDRALADRRQAERELEQISSDLEREREAKEKIYASASLADDDIVSLNDLMRKHPEYIRLRDSRAELKNQIDGDQEALDKAGQADLANEDVAALESMRDALHENMQRVDGLRDEIAGINAEVEVAKQSKQLEKQLKSLETARDELRERRHEALFDGAGKFLVRTVEKEYEKERLPAVFQRAQRHFDAFTRHHYELRIARHEGTSRLIAIELASGKERELGELSDGTRVQLLLAARLAHAEELEHGEPMPLFLDEALDQSDPERFDAIVRSLGHLAQEQDRQIFYLTSDAHDIDRMQHALAKDDLAIASKIDLGRIRRNEASAPPEMDLAFRPSDPIPSPGNRSAEAYAKVLGVPAFDPMRGYESQHFYYLLPDALPLLRELLQRGIEAAGRWRSIADTEAANRLEDDSISPQQITHRVHLLEVFCELWGRGRGRPIDRDVLVDSGAVTDKYLEGLAEITLEAHGDARRILKIIDEKQDERIKGFRAKAREGLEEYLREHRHIDDEEPLGRGDLRMQALTSSVADKLPGTVAADLLDHWWSWASH